MNRRPNTRGTAAFIAAVTVMLMATAGLANADPSTPSPTETSTAAPPSSDPSPSPAEPEPSAPATESSAPTTSPAPEPSVPVEKAPAEAPRPLAAVAERPQLDVTAKFDKPVFHTGELIKVVFAVKNVGAERVTGIRVAQDLSPLTRLHFDPRQWGDLSSGGVTIEPGATFSVTLSGRQGSAEADSVTLAGFLSGQDGMGVAQFAFAAAVERTYGRAGGIVFGDRNNNGRSDAGEELPGVTLTWSYVTSSAERFTATSDSSGRFSFPKLPTVQYNAVGSAPDGWHVLARPIEVDQSDQTDDLRIRAVRPLKDQLVPTVKFAKGTYQPGEVAHVIVTLSNKGTTPTNGITANCNRGGGGDSLAGTGPGWGELAWDRGGVDLRAGETRTFEVTEAVPDVSFDTGVVHVGCDFGYAGDDDPTNNPNAFDVALVPGGIATLSGTVQYYPEGYGPNKPVRGIPGVRVVLVDKRPCPIVAETVSDAAGNFEFANLQPGLNYLVYLFPPAGWKVKYDNPTGTHVRGRATNRVLPEVEPGEAQHPTLPTQPAECTPVTPTAPTPTPQARAVTNLASTGANITGLTAIGAATLLLGAAALLKSRRSRKPTN